MPHKSLLIIVPAYNEAQVIQSTLRDLISELKKLTRYQSQILVVDDGSRDQTVKKINQLENKTIKLVSHRLNRGLGGALGTGIEYAKRNNFNYALTFDADGQHFPQDIEVALQTLVETRSNVGIGSRLLRKNQIPSDRQLIIRLSNLLTWFLFGIHSSDSLSGFRIFDKIAIQQLHLRTERMEVSNEFFAEVNRRGFKLCHFPIKIKYTDYSRAKGQTNLNSFSIIYKLFLRLFR